MQVQRSLLLVIFFLFFFTPLLEGWMAADPLHWYRPYLIWVGVIIVMYWQYRSGNSHDL